MFNTPLNEQEESNFKYWVWKNKVPWQESATSDYDMRGFYKGLMSGDPRATTAVSGFDGRMHFPDVWKTPFHQTFSNESIYAGPNAPRWDGNRLISKDGKVLHDETPLMQQYQSPFSKLLGQQ